MKSLGRAYLVGKLRSRGLSRRQAVLVVNEMLDSMVQSLRRGMEVQFPLGKLTLDKQHFGRRWEAMDDWPAHRNLYRVVHELDAAGDRLLHPWAWTDRKRGRGAQSLSSDRAPRAAQETSNKVAL